MKKPIAITIENKDAITEALKAVNGRAESFTITTYSEVASIAENAEKRLSMLPKSDRAGARCSYNPAGPRANKYTYNAKSTSVVIERKRSGWVLIRIEKSSVRPKQKETFRMHVTQAQRDEIARRAVAEFALIRAD